jgi:hypothetical protein
LAAGDAPVLRRAFPYVRASLTDAGPTGPEDRSLVISQVEEQEAIIAELERRRRLREQLGTGQIREVG